MTIYIDEDGDIRCIGDAPEFLDGVGERRAIERLSHILPVNPIKRLAFRLLRLAFGDRGSVAQWTRQWRGPWEVRLVGSGRRFWHASRRVCVDWEMRQIERENE